MSSITNPTGQEQTHHATGKTAQALEQLEKDLENTTNAAVAEGQENVADASSSYLQKALSLADFGLSQAETYVNVGKEKLNSPSTGPAPTGLAATLTSTATAALDAAHRGIGLAHQTLHEKAPQFQHSHAQGPAHPVTVPAKSVSEALQDNVNVAQAAVQPHVDAAAGFVQPKVDAAVSGAQVQIDAVKGVVNSDKPITQQAQEASQPAVDAAKPYVTSASDTISSTYESAKATATETFNSATATAEPKET